MVETHFKFFKFQPSILYKKEPTIIFDCPARITPTKNEIPVFLFIKEYLNEKFGFGAQKVEIQIVSKGKIIGNYFFENIEEYKTYEKYGLTAYRFPVEKPKLENEKIFVYPKIGNIAVDNINSSSKMPFSVFLANEGYPNYENFPAKYYDLHCHSNHTNDHIEFGAPVVCISDVAEHCGLDGVAITDHSYDLSCKPENFLEKDENLMHWNDLCRGDCPQSPAVLLGEEISVRRNNGGAVHLGAIGLKSFVAGTADGARSGYKRKNEPTINEAVKSVLDDGGIVFAAHPGEIPNFIHRLFLRRDYWRFSDFKNLPVTAFQAVNGNFDKNWRTARKLWIKLLLSGKKNPLIAGNDSHGDFNRYRAMNIPFVSIEENFERHFGKARTGIYLREKREERREKNIIEAIKNGQTFITTGPYLSIKDAKIVVKSSNEFGKIKRIWVFFGNYKNKKEECAVVNFADEKYNYSQEISPKLLETCDYFRAECECENEKGVFCFAATSAVYIKNSLILDFF